MVNTIICQFLVITVYVILQDVIVVLNTIGDILVASLIVNTTDESLVTSLWLILIMQ